VNEELLPCPFCGVVPKLTEHSAAWGVHCDCGACVIGERGRQDRPMGDKYWAKIRQTAIDGWNRRV
jgi:hypothetical protein